MQSLTQVRHRDRFRSQIQSRVATLTVWLLLRSLTGTKIIRSLISVAKLHFSSIEMGLLFDMLLLSMFELTTRISLAINIIVQRLDINGAFGIL